MTAPIPSAPTTDLTLTAQISQYGVDPRDSVLASMANPPAKARQAEFNMATYPTNPPPDVSSGRFSNDSAATEVTDISALLKWSPPAQSSPTVASTGTGFFGPTYGANEDVILTVPGVRTAQLNVTGGRHIRLIGGKTLLNASATGTAAIRFTGVTGSVFIEGYHVDTNGPAGNKHDGIVVTGSTGAPYTLTPDVYIQNCRVEGLMSTNALNHSDVFQPQGSIGTLRIDKLTGKSNYQGLFIRNEFPSVAADIRRVNLSYEAGGDGNTFLLWIPTATDPPYPISLNNVWVTPRAGQNLIDHAIWPKAGEVNGSDPIGAYWVDAGHTKARWPANRFVNGYVYTGDRPAGDYVPASVAGLSYVSPGYAA